VSAERAALEAKKQKLAASGGDLRAVDDEEKALRQREDKIVADERDLAKKIDGLISGYQEVSTGAATGKDMAAREAQAALGETDWRRAGRPLADRGSTLADRERELARRERDTCSVQTVVAAPPPPTVRLQVFAPRRRAAPHVGAPQDEREGPAGERSSDSGE